MNIPFPVWIDIAVVAIILISAIIGRKKGLIKTVSGILALVLAFLISSQLTTKTAETISEKYVVPYIISEALPDAERAAQQEASSSFESAGSVLIEIGIPEKIVSTAAEDISSAITTSLFDQIEQLTHPVAYKLTYAVLLIVYFVLSLILLTILFKFLDLAAKLPGLNKANKTLGLILGLIFGYLIVVISSFLMLQFGIILSEELVDKTYVLNLIDSFSIIRIFF